MTQKHIVYVWLVVLALATLSVGGNAVGQGKDVYSGDAAITARVRTAIDRVPSLRKMNISVDTRGAVVRLGGFVRSMTDMGRAMAIVRDVEGVAAVMNDMKVADQPSRASVD